ncbi:MAG: cytochrome P450 [Chloroflexi bacterium]|nr:MAG: cytochrome P450 [Chloroflexota bacterium]
MQVLRDDERFSAAQGAANSMLVSDPPDHSRLRGLVNKAFSAGMVRSLEPRIREIVECLLDTAAEREQMDVIADFAYPLPLTVIAELLGVEPEKRDFFRRASTKIAIALGPATDAAIAMRAVEGRNELLVYFDSLIQKRRDEPRSDLVSALIQAEEAGTFLGHGELLAMLLLLLVGGHETTVNLIGNGLLALLHHPQPFALLAEEPGCEKRAVEELLRWDSPVQYSGRVAKEDLELGGKTIRAGQTLRLILGSANRDPEVFTDPDSLDLRREPCPHVAFGAGIHFCLGGQLARLEGQIALSSLVRRFPGMRLATEALRWRQAPVLRGLEALPVRLL